MTLSLRWQAHELTLLELNTCFQRLKHSSALLLCEGDGFHCSSEEIHARCDVSYCSRLRSVPDQDVNDAIHTISTHLFHDSSINKGYCFGRSPNLLSLQGWHSFRSQPEQVTLLWNMTSSPMFLPRQRRQQHGAYMCGHEWASFPREELC